MIFDRVGVGGRGRVAGLGVPDEGQPGTRSGGYGAVRGQIGAARTRWK